MATKNIKIPLLVKVPPFKRYDTVKDYGIEHFLSELGKLDLEKNDFMRNVFMKVSSLKSFLPSKIHLAIEDEKKSFYNVYNTDGFTRLTISDDLTYNSYFDINNGFSLRFGKTIDEDPFMCKLGPEILDVEIVKGSCPKINSENCRFCYKNNTEASGKIMSLSTFKKIIEAFPKNLTQVALGITGVNSNPFLFDMLNWLIHDKTIFGNLTLTGADLSYDNAKDIISLVGSCAVSCYDKAKELCYSTLDMLCSIRHLHGMQHPHIVMHIVAADFNMDHIMSVLEDAKNGKIAKSRFDAIVFLRAKPVGRAENIDCSFSRKNLEKIIDFYMKNLNGAINIGFDSCLCHSVKEIFSRKYGDKNLEIMIESCESGRMSAYVNVEGKMFPCSFLEKYYADEAINLLDKNLTSINDVWLNNKLFKDFRKLHSNCRSCPIYDIDVK